MRFSSNVCLSHCVIKSIHLSLSLLKSKTAIKHCMCLLDCSRTLYIPNIPCKYSKIIIILFVSRRNGQRVCSKHKFIPFELCFFDLFSRFISFFGFREKFVLYQESLERVSRWTIDGWWRREAEAHWCRVRVCACSVFTCAAPQNGRQRQATTWICARNGFERQNPSKMHYAQTIRSIQLPFYYYAECAMHGATYHCIYMHGNGQK